MPSNTFLAMQACDDCERKHLGRARQRSPRRRLHGRRESSQRRSDERLELRVLGVSMRPHLGERAPHFALSKAHVPERGEDARVHVGFRRAPS